MKSKTRNAKGSKRSPNGVTHKPKDSGMDSTTSTIADQTMSGASHPAYILRGQHQILLQPPEPATQLSVHHDHYSPHQTTSPLTQRNGTLDIHDYPRADRKTPSTSMETEFIEAIYSDLSGHSPHTQASGPDDVPDGSFIMHPDLDDLPPNSSSESDDVEYEDIVGYEDQGDDGDCEDFDEDLDVYEHDDFLSSQEAILMELRREQVEFEENVRQLQQQLQRQGSLLPLSSNEGGDYDNMRGDINSDPVEPTDSPPNGRDGVRSQNLRLSTTPKSRNFTPMQPRTKYTCNLCNDTKPSLCIERYGWVWRPVILEALATAAAAIANFTARQHNGSHGGGESLQHTLRHSEFLPRPQRPVARPRGSLQKDQESNQPLPQLGKGSNGGLTQYNDVSLNHAVSQAPSIRHMYRGTTPPPPAIRYPLPPNSPYKFGRKSSEFLEPVGEFHEFQSAEGNSRQVLLHVWPPSELDAPLLQKLEAHCRDFQDNDITRGHNGDGFLNGWRPSWKQPHQTGVLRFGHWRVRAPAGQGTRLFPPFQTPLTIAAGGGTVLGTTLNMNALASIGFPQPAGSPSSRNGSQPSQHQHNHVHGQQGDQSQQQPCAFHDSPPHAGKEVKTAPDVVPGSQDNQIRHGASCTHRYMEQDKLKDPQDLHLEATTQGRLLDLILAIQEVEKAIIARHLRYLFPTLYEKYHGLQFGTPRLFDAVATVALALDVSPRLHHDKSHTKHGFCWIVACGDFVGGDLCIPELGKRVVMRPGTVVAIRSTVVAYYIERYAKNTSMYTLYAYTSDNNWPPAA